MIAARLFNVRTVAALAAAGALLFAGTAFTASVTTTGVTETAGYGTVTTTGATLESLNFTTNSAGDTITAATLLLTGDVSAATVKINFDGTTAKSCTVAAYNATGDDTTATCSSLATPTVDAGTVGISVTKN